MSINNKNNDKHFHTIFMNNENDFENYFNSKSFIRPYFLFDSDCSICTKSSLFFKKILGSRIELIPMHLPKIEQLGLKKIPEDYWLSFHIVKNGIWSSEGNAILSLAEIFPLGGYLKNIIKFPPIFKFLIFLLQKMQNSRKLECKSSLFSSSHN